jgi:hypothetical protein
MNERNLKEGQWEDRKQWSLGVGQCKKKKFWNRYIYIYFAAFREHSTCTSTTVCVSRTHGRIQPYLCNIWTACGNQWTMFNTLSANHTVNANLLAKSPDVLPVEMISPFTIRNLSTAYAHMWLNYKYMSTLFFTFKKMSSWQSDDHRWWHKYRTDL